MKNTVAIKLRGSSIVEVLIALAITTVCIYLASAIYLGIQSSSMSFMRLKSIELCEKYIDKTRTEESYWDEIYQDSGLSIHKTVSRHPDFPDCLNIRLLVFDGAKRKLLEMESVVLGR